MQTKELVSPNFTQLLIDIQNELDNGWRIDDKNGSYFSGLLFIAYLTKQEEKEEELNEDGNTTDNDGTQSQSNKRGRKKLT